MADPCPTFDPNDYDIIEMDDCASFPTSTEDYHFVEYDNCEGFDFDPADYEIIEFDMDWGECSCCACTGCDCKGYWAQYTLAVSGHTNGTCPSCAARLNGNFILTHTAGCLWAAPIGDEECGFEDQWTMERDPGSGKWVFANGVTGRGDTFETTDDICLCGSAGLTLINTGLDFFCISTGATATVTPVPGTWVSCGAAEPSCGAEFAAVMAAEPTATKSPGRFSLECVLRGEPTGETAKCNTCGSQQEVPLYQCPVYGVCTKDGVPIDGIQWCRTCPDKVLPAQSVSGV